MDISQFVAQILGVVYSVVGLGFLLNQNYYQKNLKEIVSSPAVPYFGGVAALVTGYVLVTFHNVWVKDWVVLITIIGWMALLKGFIYLIAPEFGIDLAKNWVKKPNMATLGLPIFALGLVFVYFGFFA